MQVYYQDKLVGEWHGSIDQRECYHGGSFRIPICEFDPNTSFMSSASSREDVMVREISLAVIRKHIIVPEHILESGIQGLREMVRKHSMPENIERSRNVERGEIIFSWYVLVPKSANDFEEIFDMDLFEAV